MESREQRVQRAAQEHVEITPYDPDWPQRFADEKRHLIECIPAGLARRIEHFGSTAVPGLAAKPIVDILVEVPSLSCVKATIAPILEAQGYEYLWRASWRDEGEPSYAWFIKRNAAGQRTHHIHMLEPGSADWDRLLFRDYLIGHPGVAMEYQELKYRIAAECGDDRLAYARAKTAFIRRVTRIAQKGGPSVQSGSEPR